MRRQTLAALAMVPMLALCLPACGGNGGTANAQPSSKKTDQLSAMRAFAKCMRDNGIDMPDPQTDGSGGIKVEVRAEKAGKGDGPEKMKAAEAKCRHLQPNGGKPPKLSREEVAKMRAFAKCMREHGIEMPDPDDSGMIQHKVESKGGRAPQKESIGENPESQKFKAADKACAHLRPMRDEKGN
ncbi:hypothetical protein ACGFNU_00750 [Spirillospora sp. NPDC048911]|uniref:hypothetical protein n=1 Tax=Spirillospora sp. NPDC048911 TaxID=3364527 RepID=UPI003722A7D4